MTGDVCVERWGGGGNSDSMRREATPERQKTADSADQITDIKGDFISKNKQTPCHFKRYKQTCTIGRVTHEAVPGCSCSWQLMLGTELTELPEATQDLSLWSRTLQGAAA